MNKRLLIISLLAFCLPSFLLDAQTLSNKERRHILTKALSLIEEYENYSVLYDEDAEYRFSSLFQNTDIKIVCDIPGTEEFLSNITLSDYIRKVSVYSSTTSMSIQNVRKGEFRYEDGDWILPISFIKDISYVDDNGVMFMMDGNMFSQIDMTMEIRYVSESDKCYIESIQGKSDNTKPFLTDRFFIVEKSFTNRLKKNCQKYVSSLTVGGEPLVFNEFDQAFVPASIPEVSEPEVTIDTILVKKGDNYDIVAFNIIPPKSIRMKVRLATTLAGAYKVTTSDMISNKSNAFEIGVDVGKTWSLGNNTRIGMFTGIGFNISSLKLNLSNSLSYEFDSIAYSEENGYYYNIPIKYTIDSATESLSFKDILLPLYLEMEHRVGKALTIYWNIGAKFYANLLTSPKPYFVTGSCLVGDAINPTSFNQPFDRFILPVSYKRKPIDISAAATLGADINIWNKVLYLSVNLGYEYGITNSYSAPSSIGYYVDGSVYPIVYRNDENIAMHSMIASSTYRRQALWIGLGIKLKL